MTLVLRVEGAVTFRSRGIRYAQRCGSRYPVRQAAVWIVTANATFAEVERVVTNDAFHRVRAMDVAAAVEALPLCSEEGTAVEHKRSGATATCVKRAAVRGASRVDWVQRRPGPRLSRHRQTAEGSRSRRQDPPRTFAAVGLLHVDVRDAVPSRTDSEARPPAYQLERSLALEVHRELSPASDFNCGASCNEPHRLRLRHIATSFEDVGRARTRQSEVSPRPTWKVQGATFASALQCCLQLEETTMTKVTVRLLPVVAATLTALLAAGTGVSALMANLGAQKFFAYGGEDFSLDTELRGRVVRIDGENLFIEATSNYYQIGLRGNQIVGNPSETGTRADEQCYAGTDILAVAGPAPNPIIKLETYGVGGRQDSSTGVTPPIVMDGTTRRALRVGDFVAVSGLYVIDYSHPPYCDLHSGSWSYLRGFYRAAYAHAELHPYTPSSLRIANPQSSYETHTVVAPMYPEVYSKTYLWNKWFGVAGHMVDAAKRANQQAVFFLPAPPRPAGDVELALVERDTATSGTGFSSREYYIQNGLSGPVGITVVMRSAGTDIYQPMVYKGTFEAVWRPRRSFIRNTPRATLTAEQAVLQQQSLVSPSGRFRLTLQADGNMVLRDGSSAIWSSATSSRNVFAAVMQSDGNFVLYDAWNRPIWASNTSGRQGAYLALQDDGNLVVYGADGAPLWATDTWR